MLIKKPSERLVKMSKNDSFRMRLSSQERDILKNKSRAYGFTSITAFIKSRCLSDYLTVEKKISEIHEKIMEK